MSALTRALLVLVAIAGHAFADGATRVLLADADPELQRAVKATLAPWKLDVVVEDVPSDVAQTRSDARFVVWRANGELVVFDRDRNEAEHRDVPSGPLDPASAAAAALTVKTLMRLPPPEVAEAPKAEEPIAVVAPAPHEDSIGLRVQAGAATRAARTLALTARANLVAFVRPTSVPLSFGIAGEIGTAAEVKDTGFKGEYNDWSVVALASYAIAVAPRWEIEPYVGAGVLRSKLDGEEGMGMMMERHERATLPLLRAGTFARVRTRVVSFGALLDVGAIAGTRTYTKTGNGSQFFEVPPFAVSVGAFLAIDLSR